MRQINENEHTYPVCTNKDVAGIVSVIERGIWKHLKVETWLQLFDLVFGRDKRLFCKYPKDSEEGLKIAITELKSFYKEFKRYPLNKDLRHLSDKHLIKHG